MLQRLRTRIMGFLPPTLAVPAYAWKNRRFGEPEIRWLRRLCDAEKAAVDVGANVGIYTYWLCRYAKQCHAFEANPNLARRLSEYGDRRRLKVWPVALSDTVGKAILHVPLDPRTGLERFGSASLVDHHDGSEFMKVEVDQLRLDDIELPPIGFAKIDVEGFELNVLAGATRRITADRPNVLVEAEDRHRPHATRDVIGWFEDRSYSGFFLHEGKWHPVAKFDPARDQNPRNLATRRNPATPYINNFLFLNEHTLRTFEASGFIAR